MPENTSTNVAASTVNPLDAAFAALKTYDFGSSRAALKPLDEAVAAATADSARRRPLETRLIELLRGEAPAPAKEYACRKLAMIGSEQSVPALVALISDARLSTTARNALETIPSAEAGAALRTALPKLSGAEKRGAIHSLGRRREDQSVPALSALLDDPEAETASAAANALGEVGSTAAAEALLAWWRNATAPLRLRVADALLHCAEQLNNAGNRSRARDLYRVLQNSEQPKHVQAAAARAMSSR